MAAQPPRLARVSAAVIPVRSFAGAMLRLRTALDANRRERLAQDLAERVLRAVAPLPVVVVSSAPEVRRWAHTQHVELIDDPGSLDRAATAGVAHWTNRGASRVVVAHADLPLVEPGALARLSAIDAGRPTVTVVPSHRDGGSPVLAVPTDVTFPFAYGASSCARHIAAARQLGLAIRVVRDGALAFDVDLPADLARLP